MCPWQRQKSKDTRDENGRLEELPHAHSKSLLLKRAQVVFCFQPQLFLFAAFDCTFHPERFFSGALNVAIANPPLRGSTFTTTGQA